MGSEAHYVKKLTNASKKTLFFGIPRTFALRPFLSPDKDYKNVQLWRKGRRILRVLGCWKRDTSPIFPPFSIKKNSFWSKHAQLSSKYGMTCRRVLAAQNSILNPQNFIKFQIWKIENSTKIINFSIKYAQQFTKWGMFQISIFLIFKSCPVCFFENSRFWPEMWGKKWNLPQGFCLLLEG